jgi:hypothetical protein
MVLVAAAAILESNEKKSYGYVMLKTENVVSLFHKKKSIPNPNTAVVDRYPMVLGEGISRPLSLDFCVKEMIVSNNNRFWSHGLFWVVET